MSTLSELKKQACEQQPEEENCDALKQELLRELQEIMFMMKLCKRMKKIGVKDTNDLKKKYSNIFDRKLKVYAEVCEYDFKDELKKAELSIKVQELKKDVYKISQGGESFMKLLKAVM